MNKILIIISVTLLILFLNQCEKNAQKNASINALTSEVKEYKLKNGQLVKSQKIAIIDKNNLENTIIKQDSELKEMARKFQRVTSVQTIKAKISLPKTIIKHDSVIVYKTKDTLKFKLNGAYFGKWFEFGYNANQDSLTVEPFFIWTEIKRIDGYKRKWLFGKKTYHSDITFTNPHLEVYDMKSYQVPVPVKWHETRLFNVGVGFLGGYLLFR